MASTRIGPSQLEYPMSPFLKKLHQFRAETFDNPSARFMFCGDVALAVLGSRNPLLNSFSAPEARALLDKAIAAEYAGARP